MSTTNAFPSSALRPRRAKQVQAGGGFRSEIQGLRTIAVLTVVLYHLWPNHLSGGFVGVDVFFVISGYLITSHMVREVAQKSTLSLAKFWARRIRRLLPASFLVILASLGAVLLWVPSTLWENTAKQTAASALYVQNWILALDSVDYSTQHDDATVVQHYWSLSVEEQFYVLWPILIVIMILFTSSKIKDIRQLHQRAFKRTLFVGLSVLGVLSLSYSIYITIASPPQAYFVTPARVWEFVAGALVALLGNQSPLRGLSGKFVSWFGVAAILTAAFMFNSQTPFPGWTAAIPVLGTVAVLLCATGRSRMDAGWWLSLKPMTFIGDLSYAIYLWHWPLLIVAPYLLGHDVGTLGKILVLILTIFLSWLTKLLIEDPLRKGRLLASLPRTYGFAAASMAVMIVLSMGLTSLANTGDSAQQLDPQGTCYGPGSLAHPNQCIPPTGVGTPNPGPASVMKQNSDLRYQACQASFDGTDLSSCDLGVEQSKATLTIAMVGDSHATAWLPALEVLAEKHGWHIKAYTKTSCPLTTAKRVLASETSHNNQENCTGWGQNLIDALAKDKTISTVFTAAFSTAYTYESPNGSKLADPATEGYEAVWKEFIAAGKKVVVFDDVPRTNGQNIPTCLASHPKDVLACALPVDKAYPAGAAITHAATKMSTSGIIRVPLRDQFCDKKLCYPQIGSVIVYRDLSHLSFDYSRALAPYIDSVLNSANSD
ncbi:peptidoglycan/LPS O-acetylase OafA/YrhL [Psychromicrobium silvestre]|uniref:Peptidoglycan/LPS O-acetylase OafA/YrhL n=1 Tax=Psychromicrobium silvestre TaxID=1645614 RepID=A0A7Y9S5E3_9MICC|nr:peptidoglycan/LPS O-acetylase OafA/YrhL [Psychromicrobium silvestre]